MKNVNRVLAVTGAVLPLLLAAWLVTGSGGPFWNPLVDNLVETLCAALAGTLAIIAARRQDGRDPLGWILVAAATFSWAAGQLVRTSFEAQGATLSFPSLADVGYLLFYPLMGVALLVFARTVLKAAGLSRVVLDGLIAAGSVFLIVWNLLWVDNAGLGTPTAADLLALLYPIADVALLGMVLSLLGRRWSQRGSWTIFLCAGLVWLTIADLGFLVLVAADAYPENIYINAARPAGFLLIAWAAGLGRNEPFHRADMNALPVTPLVALPYIAVIPALFVLGGMKMEGHDFDRATFSVALVLFLSTLARQYLTGGENLHLGQQLEALRRSEALAKENLVEAQRIASLGSWEYDPKTHQYTISRELYEICGLDPATFEPSVENFIALVPEEDREPLTRIIRNVARNPRSVDIDHRIVRPDGSIRWVHERAEPKLDDQRRIVRLTGIVHDITLRKEGEDARWKSLLQSQELKRLRELDRVRTDFINRAAHELRTPLTPLNAVIGLWERQAQDNGAVRVGTQSLDVMRRNVARLTVLVDELLDAARIQSDRLVLNRADVDLTQTLRNSVKSFQAAAKAQDKRLALVAPEAQLINIDESRITQVIDNLLDNALKFTEPQGRIHVEVTSRAADVLVSVYDDGVGLTEDQRVRLFEPFSRPHESLHRQRTGTGLGLYLSRNIIEIHGGHIWCESGGEGRGSVFSFTLPRPQAVATNEIHESPVINVGPGSTPGGGPSE